MWGFLLVTFVKIRYSQKKAHLSEAGVLTIWFSSFGPFLVAPKADCLLFLGPNWATGKDYGVRTFPEEAMTWWKSMFQNSRPGHDVRWKEPLD